VAENLPQCGFCQPGMIMTAAILLRKNSDPSDGDIDAAITNICRCGTYPRVRGAGKRPARISPRRSGPASTLTARLSRQGIPFAMLSSEFSDRSAPAR